MAGFCRHACDRPQHLIERQQAKLRQEQEAKANPDPEHVQNMYQNYAGAFQRELEKGKQKKDEVVADKQVNVAMTQQDSIFKNISLPGGISTKATEYKNLAEKGEKWESPVFSIGTAGETPNTNSLKQQHKQCKVT